MCEDYNNMFDSYDELSDYEKEEIYDYEIYKPLCIEQAIKSKDLKNIRDNLCIYALGVEKVLSDRNWISITPVGVEKMIHFLNLAVESNNLHVLRTVWNYGIEYYFNKESKHWTEVLMYIADMIYKNEVDKMLKFLINKIELDDRKIFLKVKDKGNKWSGAKRPAVLGNLLDAAIYYNNLEAIELLISKQVKFKAGNLKSHIETYRKEDIDTTIPNPKNNSFFYFDVSYHKETLCSFNPTSYALDNGNIEALRILSKYGYKVDFDSIDFSYQLANFGHIKTIKYFLDNYPDKFTKIDIRQVIRATNLPLLKILLNKGFELKSKDFNQLFIYNNNYHDFNDNSYDLIKEKNIEKCVSEFVKRGIKVRDIEFSILYALSTENRNFLNLSLSLYNSKTLDLTPIISDFRFNLELLTTLSERYKLVCNTDNLINFAHLRIRDFQKICKLVELQIENSKTINNLTKHILDQNSINGLKLLIKYKFISSNNYYDAIDYIVEKGLDKLLSSLVIYSMNTGGIKKDYGI